MNMFIVALVLVLGFIIGNIVMLKYMDKKEMKKSEQQQNTDDKEQE